MAGSADNRIGARSSLENIYACILNEVDMLKIYGIKNSRATRTLWMCRELGLEYEQVQVSFADGSAKSAEYLIPSIDDAGFQLWESMAINVYLAKKHNSPLLPQDLQSEALVLQWSFWVMTEVEKYLLTVLLQRMEFPPDSQAGKYFRERNPKNPEAEQQAIDALKKPLSVLNEHLTGRDYLLGNEFTLADLNVASVLSWAIASKLDLSATPQLKQWLGRCLARPAARG
jgi:glutathione S-transferase